MLQPVSRCADSSEGLLLTQVLRGLSWEEARSVMVQRYGLAVKEVEDMFVVKPEVSTQHQMFGAGTELRIILTIRCT